jgi:hypothetical protein
MPSCISNITGSSINAIDERWCGSGMFFELEPTKCSTNARLSIYIMSQYLINKANVQDRDQQRQRHQVKGESQRETHIGRDIFATIHSKDNVRSLFDTRDIFVARVQSDSILLSFPWERAYTMPCASRTKTTFKRPFSDALCNDVTWTPLHIASEKVPLNFCLFLLPLYTAPAWHYQAIHLEERRTNVIEYHNQIEAWANFSDRLLPGL